jgi:hypothetical protein
VDSYTLNTLDRWKMYSGADGKTYLKVVPGQGKHEMYEVEPHLTFRDMDGNVVAPDYFIITWRRGMAKPECVIQVGGATGQGTFEQPEPEKPERKSRKKLYGFSADDVEPDDGA